MNALLETTALTTIDVSKGPQPKAKTATKTAPKDAAPKGKDGPRIEAPEWWNKLTPDGRDSYLRNHPASKLNHFLRQELKSYLEKNPKDRKTLRKVIKEIAADPDKAFKEDFDKLAAASKKVKPKDAKEIKDSLDQVNKSKKSKGILKTVVKVMAIAGVLTLGAGIVAMGGLPYLILGPRMVMDTIGLVKDINHRVNQGEDAVKACFTSISNTVRKAASDPAVLAAALALSQKRQASGGRDSKTSTTPKAAKSNHTSKKQSAPEKKAKDAKPAKEKPAPKARTKPHNSNAVS